uniref:Uncharacterized protein n=1 Tax=Cacopsylla melanoneura TaxID=428564 RepID=A0A8D8XBP2_9HEMI
MFNLKLSVHVEKIRNNIHKDWGLLRAISHCHLKPLSNKKVIGFPLRKFSKVCTAIVDVLNCLTNTKSQKSLDLPEVGPICIILCLKSYFEDNFPCPYEF